MAKKVNDIVPGKIEIMFKPDVPFSKIENILKQYPHEKVFPEIKVDNETSEEDKTLAYTYVLSVNEGAEKSTAEKIYSEYSSLISNVDVIGKRRLIR